MGKEYMKKTGEELQQYLQFRRRGSRVEAKKGKGAVYNRGREKDKARKQENEYYVGATIRDTLYIEFENRLCSARLLW